MINREQVITDIFSVCKIANNITFNINLSASSTATFKVNTTRRNAEMYAARLDSISYVERCNVVNDFYSNKETYIVTLLLKRDYLSAFN